MLYFVGQNNDCDENQLTELLAEGIFSILRCTNSELEFDRSQDKNQSGKGDDNE
jgi:hypothetical protein